MRTQATETAKKVMTRAWAIRKAAAMECGCKVSEIMFSECLRIAWRETKMKQATFTATAKNGRSLTITAVNTATKIVTTYPVTQIAANDFVVELTTQQAKELLGVEMPSTIKTARVRLDNPTAWKAFEVECWNEQRNLNPLKTQREALVTALDKMIDCGGDVAHPASQKAIQYNAARKALEAFDAAHPEVK